MQKFLSINDENTRNLHSTCYQIVQRFKIWLTEMFSSSMCLGLIENYDKSCDMVIWAVFNAHEYVDSRRVL